MVTDLPLVSCHLVNLPDGGRDCSPLNPDECIRCPILGRFVTGEGIDEYTSLSHVICFVLWIITCIIGTLGTIANCLIILILQRQKSGRAFDTFLVGLAGFDIVCSVSSLIGATSAVFYFQNWSRGAVTLYAFYGGTLTALFGRSGSSFMTVIITLERYLVVAFPMKFGQWFTVTKTRCLVFGVLVWAFIMAFPRYSSVYVDRNVVGRNIDSTRELDYIMLSTKLDKFWYGDMKGFFDQIDFWGPLPLLLLFNGLVYFHVRRFELRRKELNKKHKKDIRAAKMFLPVVIILFLCNIEPIIHYYYIFSGTVYRELYMGILVSFTINSAVNLPIYYLKGSSFRRETKALLSAYFPCLSGCFHDVEEAKNSSSRGITSKQNARTSFLEVGSNDKYT